MIAGRILRRISFGPGLAEMTGIGYKSGGESKMKRPFGALLAAGFALAALVSCQPPSSDGSGTSGCSPATPAAPAKPKVSCPSNPDNWVPSTSRHGPTRIAEVEAAVAEVRKAHPEFFHGDKLIGECHAAAPAFFTALAAELRANGLCAWPAGDAIHPASRVQGVAEEYHLVNFGGCQLWPASRNNYKGDWIIR
jgi:hypothetical protein